MRCPDCNKFVSFEEGDPEVNDLEVSANGDGTATVSATVRIVNLCSDCSTELTETELEMEEVIEIPKEGHDGEGCELEVKETSSERTQRSGYFKKGVFVPAFGRYARTYYGASVDFQVTCTCEKMAPVEGTMEGDEQASAMDVLV